MPTIIFGLGHILYLLFTTIGLLTALFLIKKFCKTKRSQDIAIYASASLLLALILANRISIAILTNDWLGIIPVSFCGMTSLLLSVFVLVTRNRNHHVFHFLAYLAFFGGVVATLIPDFMTNYDSMSDARVVTGLMHHTTATYLVVLLVILGRFKPTLKRWYCIPLGLAVYMTMGLFFIHALGVDDAMLINGPLLPGLYWYICGAIFLGIHIPGLMIYEFIKRQVSKRRQASVTSKEFKDDNTNL